MKMHQSDLFLFHLCCIVHSIRDRFCPSSSVSINDINRSLRRARVSLGEVVIHTST